MNDPAPQNGPQSSTEDRTRFNLALLGFYLSCTVVGVAVTVAAAALIVFGDANYSGVVATVAIVITAVACTTTLLTLKSARSDR